MAKKRTNGIPPPNTVPIEKAEAITPIYLGQAVTKQGENDAFKWFTRLCVDRRLKPADLDRRLKESLNGAKKRMLDYKKIFEDAPSQTNRHNADYWKYYHSFLSYYVNIEEKAKTYTKQKLNDFFIDTKMTFEDFQIIIEKARVTTKGKMMVRGTSFRAMGTFEALKELEILSEHDWVDYRNCFTKYYIKRIYQSSTYSNAIEDDKGQIKRFKDSFIRSYKMLSEHSL